MLFRLAVSSERRRSTAASWVAGRPGGGRRRPRPTSISSATTSSLIWSTARTPRSTAGLRRAGAQRYAISGSCWAGEDWERAAALLQGHDVPFLVEPHVRYRGEPREEALLLVADPSGNAIEFKTFRDRRHLFGQPVS